jgi:tetratricopeptide (TPR) repeat protein
MTEIPDWLQARIDHYQTEAATAHDHHDNPAHAKALNQLGGLYCSVVVDVPKAIDCYQQAFLLARSSSDLTQEAESLIGLGNCYGFSRTDENPVRDETKAIDYFYDALRLVRQLKDQERESTTLAALGKLWMRQGNYSQAHLEMAAALKLVRAAKDRQREAAYLIDIAGLFNLHFDHYPALRYFKEALAITRELDNQHDTMHILYQIATIYRKLGQYPLAVSNYESLITAYQSLGESEQSMLLVHTGDLADTYLEMAEYDKAIACYERGITLTQTLPNGGSSAFINYARDQIDRAKRSRNGSTPP